MWSGFSKSIAVFEPSGFHARSRHQHPASHCKTTTNSICKSRQHVFKKANQSWCCSCWPMLGRKHVGTSQGHEGLIPNTATMSHAVPLALQLQSKLDSNWLKMAQDGSKCSKWLKMAQVSDPGLLSCHMRQVHDSVHNLDPGSHGIDSLILNWT